MTKSKLLIALISLSLLSGCGLFGRKSEKQVETIYVDRVVTAQPRKPNIPQRPRLPVEDLTPEQMKDQGEVAKAIKASVKAIEGYVTQLETILEGVGTTEIPASSTK